MEQSRQHQQTLREEGLSPEMQASFQAMTEQSLADQARMEDVDQPPFGVFLDQYLKA